MKTPESNNNISVGKISALGFTLLTSRGEIFLAFEDFPWFKDVQENKIANVQEIAPYHYYWADLDIDLTHEIIKHPKRFPIHKKNY